MLLSDDLLLNYKRCQRRAYLNVFGNPEKRDPQRDFLLKLRQESEKHQKNVLRESYPVYHQPQVSTRNRETRAQATLSLMQQGADCIYQGVLLYKEAKLTLVGTPDLLIKQPGKSKFGDWCYFPISIQLGRRPKPEYKLIAAFYALLLLAIQGVLPSKSQLILREQNTYTVNLDNWMPKLRSVLRECLSMFQKHQEPEVFISRQRCSLCHWHSHCHGIATAQQHLSLVPGVTPHRYEYLQTLGVTTLQSLATASSTHMGELMGVDVAIQLKQQAQSLLAQRAIIKQQRDYGLNGTIPTAGIEIYFDIEAEPGINLDYLLGILIVDRLTNTEKFYPFLAEKPEDEGAIWEQFLAQVNVYPEAPIFHYSPYELETIKRLARLYHSPQQQIDKLLSRLVDLHQWVIGSVILPVESYSLKFIANWLGFQWRDRGVTGDQSVCWYDQWLHTGDRSLLAAILRYNEDDCRATYQLKDWLVEFLSNQME